MWASDIFGGLIWALGFAIEAVADQQKYNFKMNPSNKGKFVNTGAADMHNLKTHCVYIRRLFLEAWVPAEVVGCYVGLWSLARYPNYFGEFCVWIGIWLFCIPSFRKGYWAATISPVYVFAQIMGLSGVPMQEKQQKERWGDDPDYQEYRRNTRLLVPLPR